jgi:hypothetical protein
VHIAYSPFIALFFSSFADDKPCFWRVVNVQKRINRTCSERTVNAGVVARNPACFNGCAQPTNTTSTCWIHCFYSTLLGDRSNTSLVPASAGLGMPGRDIQALWDSPFAAGSACPDI